jgi:hypothetical protein
MKTKIILGLLSMALLWHCAKEDEGYQVAKTSPLQSILDSLLHYGATDFETFTALKAQSKKTGFQLEHDWQARQQAKRRYFEHYAKKLKLAWQNSSQEDIQAVLQAQLDTWRQNLGTALVATPCYDRYQHDMISAFETVSMCNTKHLGRAFCQEVFTTGLADAEMRFEECIYDTYGIDVNY